MQDKRFFQLVFTPFISTAISGDMDAMKNIDLMADRMREMPDKLRKDLIAGLEAELTVSKIKSRNLPSDLRTAYSRKIDAIEALLAKDLSKKS